MKNLIKPFIAVIALIGLVGCQANPTISQGSLRGDVYSYKEARKSQSVNVGYVISSRYVQIEGKSSNVGLAVGGLIGAAAGNKVGGGNGKKVATALGALFGASVGDKMEQRVRKIQGVEVIVRTDKGRTYSVVQEYNGENFSRGTPVMLIGSRSSMRVAPL